MVDRAVDSLHTFCDPLLLVANDLGLYSDVRATLVRDVVPHQGPLGAIYAALLFSPNDWVFVRATDMPYLVPELAAMLLDMRGEYDVVAPVYRGLYEPLLALYHRRCLPLVAATLEGHERKVVSFYQKVKVRTVEQTQWCAVDAEGRSFWNINTVEDWEKLQWS